MDLSKKSVDRSVDVQTLGFQVRESYKTARTNIVYSILKKGCKKIVFTSSEKGEGKTVTASNIAIALAQQVETKVLVVDCDLRRPRVHTTLSLTPTPGLTNFLNDECTAQDVVKSTNLPNLYAICYGAVPPNPSELLASDAMKDFVHTLEQEYDYIIFDAPPIGVVVDAIPIIKLSDGVVLVVRNNQTTYPQLTKAVDMLKRSDAKILGIILNRVKMTDVNKKGKYKGYGYYGYY